MWKTEVSWWLDGTPYELKGSRTVWDGGKDGDNFKVLPIVIISFLGHSSQSINLVEELLELDKHKNVDCFISQCAHKVHQ